MKFGRKSKFALGAVLALLAGGVAVWVGRTPLLTALARWWIVADAPASADAIVVLGGGVDTRPLAAARLHREGWAKRILVLSPEISLAAQRGFAPSTVAISRRLMQSEQVPDEAIQVIGEGVGNTLAEARAISSWAQTNQVSRLLVPTDIFHTRRAGWLLRRELKPQGIEVLMIPVNPRQYSATNWWQRDQGLLDFQNELLKTVYYWWPR